MIKIIIVSILMTCSFCKEMCYSFDKDMFGVSQKSHNILYIQPNIVNATENKTIEKERVKKEYCFEEGEYLFFENQEQAIRFNYEKEYSFNKDKQKEEGFNKTTFFVSAIFLCLFCLAFFISSRKYE